MTELRKRMLEDLKLAGLAPKSHRLYIWAVRQLAAYYMTPPDRLSERQVQEYLLYVRDELGCPKGTFSVTWAGIKFCYYHTLGYDWPLLTKKNSQAPARAVAGCPLRCRLPPPDRGLGAARLSRLLHVDVCLWSSNDGSDYAPRDRRGFPAHAPAGDREGQ